MESMSVSPVLPNANATCLDKQIEVTKEEWMEGLKLLKVPRNVMNRLVMNYLVTEGYKEAAEKFKCESGMDLQDDFSRMDDRIKIKNAVLDGRILDAIDLINQLYPELLDNNKHLYFHLLQQQTIELIREKKIEEALDFAQSHLAERGEDNTDILPEIECTLALLAFEQPDLSPYGDLLQPSHRQKVANEVNAALLSNCGLESNPKLAGLLRLIVWSQEQLDAKKVKYPHMIDFSDSQMDTK